METSSASNEGRQSLHIAAQSNHVFVMEYLVRRGAETSSANNDGFQPLHVAAESGHILVAEHLARRGAEVSSVSGDGEQPLHVAAWNGYIFVAEHLAMRGAEASSTEKNGWQPLHVAARFGHIFHRRWRVGACPALTIRRFSPSRKFALWTRYGAPRGGLLLDSGCPCSLASLCGASLRSPGSPRSSIE